MRTNLEKWNYYMGLINAKEQEFINSNISDIPTYKLYTVLYAFIVRWQKNKRYE